MATIALLLASPALLLAEVTPEMAGIVRRLAPLRRTDAEPEPSPAPSASTSKKRGRRLDDEAPYFPMECPSNPYGLTFVASEGDTAKKINNHYPYAFDDPSPCDGDDDGGAGPTPAPTEAAERGACSSSCVLSDCTTFEECPGTLVEANRVGPSILKDRWAPWDRRPLGDELYYGVYGTQKGSGATACAFAVAQDANGDLPIIVAGSQHLGVQIDTDLVQAYVQRALSTSDPLSTSDLLRHSYTTAAPATTALPPLLLCCSCTTTTHSNTTTNQLTRLSQVQLRRAARLRHVQRRGGRLPVP